MNDTKSLSESRLSYCGYKIVSGRLVRISYDPDPSNSGQREQFEQSLDSQSDGMLYDPMDIGTDLCK